MNRKVALAMAGFMLLQGCPSTEFKRFEGKDLVYEGTGGTRETVDGIDIWENGQPARKYKLVGYIDDNRVNGPLPMLSLKGDLADAAKEAGGDAVITVSSLVSQSPGVAVPSVTTMHMQSYGGATYGTGVSSPGMVGGMPWRSAKYVVIKYVK